MSKGAKALAGQVAQLRIENNKLKTMNFRLHNEVRKLQSIQMQMLDKSFFKAFKYWRKKRKGFNVPMVEYDGQMFPIGSQLTSKENGELIIAPPGTPEEEIVAIL